MAKPVAVTNTSPVIALVGVGELRLYDALFARVVVPFEVWDELMDKPGAPEPDALRALEASYFDRRNPPRRLRRRYMPGRRRPSRWR